MIFIHGGIYKICSCGNISSHQESGIKRIFPLDIVDAHYRLPQDDRCKRLTSHLMDAGDGLLMADLSQLGCYD
jgi:hypothetical protein